MSRQTPGPAASLRPEVLDFEPYTAGRSIEEIQERYGLSQVIKMASNENPLGTSPLVQKRLRDKAATAFRYPQSGNPRLVRALGEHLGVDPACIVPGNGSDEIIDLLVRVRAVPGRDNVAAFRPCFSMYSLQARFHGVEFRQADLNADFTFPWDDLLALVDARTALVFVTTPDNPSGHAPPASELLALRRRLPGDCLLVLDEAYMDFALPQEDYSLLPRLHELGSTVILRTFSKLYGLAGLRLGYGVMPAWLADYLWRVRLPFSVNILAEEAGMAALADGDFVRATLDTVLRGREYLERELTALGCAVQPSQANFLLFSLPPGAPEAATVFESLLARGVIIRPLASYGLPRHLRVSVGSDRENRTLVRQLAAVLDAARAKA